jgi:uncharacterized protein YgiM (DUF1202 family)
MQYHALHPRPKFALNRVSAQMSRGLVLVALALNCFGLWIEPVSARSGFSVDDTCYTLTIYDPSDKSANLRSSPNGRILTSVANGAQVRTMGVARIDPNWTRVRLGRQEGYISSKLLRRTVYQVIDRQDKTVNLRRSPNGPIVRVLANETHVLFVRSQGTWSQVSLPNGSMGYVLSKFLLDPVCG